jgi:hypothetical protein
VNIAVVINKSIVNMKFSLFLKVNNIEGGIE